MKNVPKASRTLRIRHRTVAEVTIVLRGGEGVDCAVRVKNYRTGICARWLLRPTLRMNLSRWILSSLLASCVSASAQSSPRTLPEVPGPRGDGSVLLPNQWSLRPVGRQVVLGDFPINIAMHPGNRFAAVLHSGYG